LTRTLLVTDSLSLRAYRPADHERVLAVHEVALRDEGMYVEGAPEPDLADFEAAYPDRDGVFLVGTIDGRIVGTGALRPAQGDIAEYFDVDGDTAEVKRIRVAPTHQGRGHGRRIYDELERSTHDRGFGELVLDTMPTLTPARGLNESAGSSASTGNGLRTGQSPSNCCSTTNASSKRLRNGLRAREVLVRTRPRKHLIFPCME
jgi:ribosomal protein S18 acetylase RimI-like enzyme